MNVFKANNQQLKNIIEWDNDCPAPVLFKIYDEAVKRDIYKHFVIGCIIKFFRSTVRAERLTKMTIDELKWFCYEKGFEALDKFTPGNRPFIALWGFVIKYGIRDIVRNHNAQKRSAEISQIDDIGDWILPQSHHNTEMTAINRVYINSLLKKLTKTEKEIVFMRYEGYTLDEVAFQQNVSRGGIQKRIQLYLKKLKEA
jgi:RNA polymerase sigma factor (sigma-70 family)